VLDREFYLPAPEHLATQSSTNRQGRGDALDADNATRVLDMLREDATRNYDHYLELLNEDEQGKTLDETRPHLARELARITLTLSSYTQWYWKTDLHNLFNFLSLRADPHAQYEIRAYAEPMLDMVRSWVPTAAAAFEEYRLGAFTLSAGMRAALKRMLAGERVDQETSGLSKREWGELQAALG
jgi:thymidylate synthase (FAD)